MSAGTVAWSRGSDSDRRSDPFWAAATGPETGATLQRSTDTTGSSWSGRDPPGPDKDTSPQVQILLYYKHTHSSTPLDPQTKERAGCSGWMVGSCRTCTNSGRRVLLGNSGPPAGLSCRAAAPFQLVMWADSGPTLGDRCRCRRLCVSLDFVPSGKEVMTSPVTRASLDAAVTGSVLVSVFSLSPEAWNNSAEKCTISLVR